MEKSLDFTENYIKVSIDDKAIIKHVRKSLLFNDKQTWMEKNNDR